MARKNYSVDEVLKQLYRKHDVKIDSNQKIVRVLCNESRTKINDLGNNSWGKINFLVNYCGYYQFFVTEF